MISSDCSGDLWGPLGFKFDIARVKKLSTLNSGVYDLQYQHLMTRGYNSHRRNKNMESFSPGGPAIYVILKVTGPSITLTPFMVGAEINQLHKSIR